jgi:hypothetical protein
VYASTGSLRDPQEMANLAEHCLGCGFTAMKLRFGRPDRRDDVAVVEAIGERVGDRLVLMVDCNRGWQMPWDTQAPWQLKDALRVARELEKLDVYWLEEPLHRGDIEGMAALRASTDLRIAGGEGSLEVHELQELVRRGCLDVLQPDVTWCGGISGLRRVATMAQEHHLTFTPHTWTIGIGMVANMHLAAGLASSPYVELPYDPPGWKPGTARLPAQRARGRGRRRHSGAGRWARASVCSSTRNGWRARESDGPTCRPAGGGDSPAVGRRRWRQAVLARDRATRFLPPPLAARLAVLVATSTSFRGGLSTFSPSHSVLYFSVRRTCQVSVSLIPSTDARGPLRKS